MNKPKLHFSRGLTVIELVISIAVLMIILTLVTNMIFSTSRTQSRVRMENHMRSTIQTALFRISAQLNQSRMIMNGNAGSGLGYNYLTAVQLGGAPAFMQNITPVNTTSKHLLPTIQTTGSLSPEKDCATYPNNYFRANSVGNVLMFAKYLGKFNKINIASITEKRNLDLYEFKLYYLTQEGTGSNNFLDFWSNSPSKKPIRLIEWTSKPYADYTQFADYIADSTNPNRTTIRAALTAAGITEVWDRSATTIGTAFYTVGAGTSATINVIGSPTITRNRHNDILRFGSDAYSVAYNTNNTTGNANYFPIRHQVPYFYQHNPAACTGAIPADNTTPNSSGGAFPYGFEVMVTGPASGRNVLMRITSAARSHNGLISHADMLTTYARDL